MESRRHELNRITLKKMQNARGSTEQCMICLELSHNQRSTNGQNTYQSCMFTMLHLIHLQHSPHFLMFGQGARLPIDLLLRGDEEVDENQSDWLAEHQARLTDAYQRAEEHLKQQAEKRQDQHFEREYNIPIQKGQLVYLRNHVRGRKRFKMLGILSRTKLSMSHETTLYHFTQWNLWIVQVKLRRCIEVT